MRSPAPSASRSNGPTSPGSSLLRQLSMWPAGDEAYPYRWPARARNCALARCRALSTPFRRSRTTTMTVKAVNAAKAAARGAGMLFPFAGRRIGRRSSHHARARRKLRCFFVL
eukprot:scaffold5872_cov104-Isochrysis_galbana.AAC.3